MARGSGWNDDDVGVDLAFAVDAKYAAAFGAHRFEQVVEEDRNPCWRPTLPGKGASHVRGEVLAAKQGAKCGQKLAADQKIRRSDSDTDLVRVRANLPAKLEQEMEWVLVFALDDVTVLGGSKQHLDEEAVELETRQPGFRPWLQRGDGFSQPLEGAYDSVDDGA